MMFLLLGKTRDCLDHMFTLTCRFGSSAASASVAPAIHGFGATSPSSELYASTPFLPSQASNYRGQGVLDRSIARLALLYADGLCSLSATVLS